MNTWNSLKVTKIWLSKFLFYFTKYSFLVKICWSKRNIQDDSTTFLFDFTKDLDSFNKMVWLDQVHFFSGYISCMYLCQGNISLYRRNLTKKTNSLRECLIFFLILYMFEGHINNKVNKKISLQHWDNFQCLEFHWKFLYSFIRNLLRHLRPFFLFLDLSHVFELNDLTSLLFSKAHRRGHFSAIFDFKVPFFNRPPRICVWQISWPFLLFILQELRTSD